LVLAVLFKVRGQQFSAAPAVRRRRLPVPAWSGAPPWPSARAVWLVLIIGGDRGHMQARIEKLQQLGGFLYSERCTSLSRTHEMYIDMFINAWYNRSVAATDHGWTRFLVSWINGPKCVTRLSDQSCRGDNMCA
jgi:hypothetical protein